MISAGRGLVIIGLFIVLGIALLFVVDDGSTGSTAKASSTTTTQGSGPPSTTAAPITTASAARPPAQVKIKVYNAGKAQGSASKMTDQLRTAGYTNALGAADLKPPQTGTTVSCKPGFDGAEAAALATAVGSGAKVAPFPNPAPAGSADANCIVILGT